jgi:hypothetical protein
MPAAVAVQSRSTDLESEIALICSPETESLLRTIGDSRWSVRKMPDNDAARAEIERGEWPILICGNKNWREVVEMAGKSRRRPAVIVVPEHASDFEWLRVLEAGGHYLPLDKLNHGQLFSLLNMLWRNWQVGWPI